MSNTFNRRLSRLIAVQVMYSCDIRQPDSDIRTTVHAIIASYSRPSNEINEDFVVSLVEKLYGNLATVDEAVDKHTERKPITKLNTLLKALIRCGAGELMYLDTPYKVVISEYIKLAEDFFSLREIGFINAILDNVAKDLNKK